MLPASAFMRADGAMPPQSRITFLRTLILL